MIWRGGGPLGPVGREVSWTRVLLLGYSPEPGPTFGKSEVDLHRKPMAGVEGRLPSSEGRLRSW